MSRAWNSVWYLEFGFGRFLRINSCLEDKRFNARLLGMNPRKSPRIYSQVLPRGPLRRRLVFPVLPGLLARLRQQVERALNASDNAGGNAGVARRRVRFVVPQQRLGRCEYRCRVQVDGWQRSVEAHGALALRIPAFRRLMEQAVELAGCHRLIPNYKIEFNAGLIGPLCPDISDQIPHRRQMMRSPIPVGAAQQSFDHLLGAGKQRCRYGEIK